MLGPVVAEEGVLEWGDVSLHVLEATVSHAVRGPGEEIQLQFYM